MSRGQIPMEAFGECHRDNCEYPLPWDMSAIAINDTNAFCSPACAREFLEESKIPVETVTLHDPQFHADKPEGVDDDSVSIWREVDGKAEALVTVGELEQMYEGAFTVE